MARTLVAPRRTALARLQFSPAQVIIASFALIILAGGIILSLPISSASGERTSFLTALFTATSATCVTGLVVVDTADHYSLVGEIVILLLIQLGGLGYMTVATLMALAVGRRIGLRERMILQEAHNLYTIGGIVRFTRTVVLVTLSVEAVGALIFALHWASEFGVGRGVYYGIFHAVSSFNNAGFDLMGNFRSLTGYMADLTVVSTTAGLIILGGLGFTVLSDLAYPRRFTLHAKIVLSTSAALIGLATLLIFLLEYAHPPTLGPLPVGQKLLAAFFQSVTPRTAGFNTIDIGQLYDPTLMLLIALMFIGASPGGTGGGIKTTTFVVPLAAMLSMVRGRPDPELLGRRIPPVVVYKAVTIALGAVAFVITMATLLSLSEPVSFIAALFEVVSAFGTVGLSTGITPSLGTIGQLIVMTTVFTGRVGLLTVAFALTRRQTPAKTRFPEERLYVG